MITHDETMNGKHYWAITKDQNMLGITQERKMLVVLKMNDQYEVCGPWECGIDYDRIEIIEEIKVPDGYEDHKLYYATKLLNSNHYSNP